MASLPDSAARAISAVSVDLHLVVALPSEARPFLDAFRLRANERHGGMRIYTGDGVRLVVTGIGKVAASASVGFLAAAFPDPAIWLNVGIVGHSSRRVGDVLMVHAAEDRASGQTYYPPLVVEPPVVTSWLTTVDQPETDYSQDGAFDMEATGFFAAARRFQTAELVHSLKVVSDGPEAPIAGITREKITAWVELAVPAVNELHARLAPLALELQAASAPSPAAEELLARWHFSVSDRRALRRELQRARVLEAELPAKIFDRARRGLEAVARLREYLDGLAVQKGSVLGNGPEDGSENGP